MRIENKSEGSWSGKALQRGDMEGTGHRNARRAFQAVGVKSMGSRRPPHVGGT